MKVEFANIEVRQAAKDSKWAWEIYSNALFELEYFLALHPKYEHRDLEAEARFQEKARELATVCREALVDCKRMQSTLIKVTAENYGDPNYIEPETAAEAERRKALNRAHVFNFLTGGISDTSCDL